MVRAKRLMELLVLLLLKNTFADKTARNDQIIIIRHVPNHLKVAVYNNITPFIQLNWENDDLHISGIEYNLLQVIAEKLDLVLQFKFEPRRKWNQEKIYIEMENQIGINSIDYSSSDSDIIVGALYSNLNVSAGFRSSYPYLYDRLGYCLKLPDAVPRWQYLFIITDPNSTELWYFGLACIVLTVLLFFLLNGFEKRKVDFHSAFVLVFGVILGASVTFLKYVRKFSSQVLACVMLYCLFVLIATYNGFFFNILLRPRYFPRMATIQDLIKNDFKMIAVPEIVVRFVKEILFKLSYTIFLRRNTLRCPKARKQDSITTKI